MTTRRRSVLLWIAAGIGLLAVLAGLGAFLAPRVLPNLATTVEPTASVATVAHDGVRVRVTVPAGWAAHRPWDDDAALVLRTPDGVLTLTLRAEDADADDALAALATEVGEATLGVRSEEHLASGLRLAHREGAGVLVAALSDPSASGVAAIVVRGPDGLDGYRAELAAVLDTVGVGS